MASLRKTSKKILGILFAVGLFLLGCTYYFQYVINNTNFNVYRLPISITTIIIGVIALII